MSPGVLTLAEACSKLTRQCGAQWWQLYSHPAPARGLMDIASANSLVTDSAAAASAWGSGRRINNGVFNIDAAGREGSARFVEAEDLRRQARVVAIRRVDNEPAEDPGSGAQLG